MGVRLQDGTTKTLEELGPSDLVETTADFQERGYERWLFDFHGSMGARQAVVVEDFVEIVHEAEPPLRITANHFLYALRDGEPTLVLAGSVVVGDVLLVTTDAGVKPSIIRSLRMVKDRGIYAPLTFSGRLAVNGVVVSSYAASSSAMGEDACVWQCALPLLLRLPDRFRVQPDYASLVQLDPAFHDHRSAGSDECSNHGVVEAFGRDTVALDGK